MVRQRVGLRTGSSTWPSACSPRCLRESGPCWDSSSSVWTARRAAWPRSESPPRRRRRGARSFGSSSPGTFRSPSTPTACPRRKRSRPTCREAAEEIAEQAEAAVPAGVEYEAKLCEGQAADVLVEESEGAEVLVVGSRGLGGFARLVLGSVSQHVSHHAKCPVVIVPPDEHDKRLVVLAEPEIRARTLCWRKRPLAHRLPGLGAGGRLGRAQADARVDRDAARIRARSRGSGRARRSPDGESASRERRSSTSASASASAAGASR